MKKPKTTARLPRSVQNTIPIQQVSVDGIFYDQGVYSCCWSFEDVNYESASDDAQESVLTSYAKLINRIDDTMHIQVCLTNHYRNPEEYATDVLLADRNEANDLYRRDMNAILQEEAGLSNYMQRERYLILSRPAQNWDEAKRAFARMKEEMNKAFYEIDSKAVICDLGDRFRTLHNFYRAGEERFFHFDVVNLLRSGTSVKDTCCPDYIKFHPDYVEIGKRFARVLVVSEFATILKDSLISELLETKSSNVVVSQHIDVLSKDASRKFIQKKMDAVESDIEKWGRQQRKQNNFTSEIPYAKRQMREACERYMKEISANDQRLLFLTLCVCVTGSSIEELDLNTQDVVSTASAHACDLRRLFFQQEEGLSSALPFGKNLLSIKRSMITDGVAVLHPFSTVELSDPNGLWKGHHPGTFQQIFVNRKKSSQLNGNGFIFGVSGSGKSFYTKVELLLTALSSDDDVIVIDPDREYGQLIAALGGEVITLSPNSDQRINAMDIDLTEGIDNCEKVKSAFIQALVEQARDASPSSAERSIIDRVVMLLVRKYITFEQSGGESRKLTLVDFYNELICQPEPEGKRLALDLEIFITGSMNIFANESNVNLMNRLVCFDIHDIQPSVSGLALLVILDFCTQRTTANRKVGRFTSIFIDEVQELFKHDAGAEYLQYAWRHVRKMGGMMTAATQHASTIIDHPVGSVMLNNSEYTAMLNQAEPDIEGLKEILQLSDQMITHLRSGATGTGLIRSGRRIVPFEMNFPENTELYKLMDTSINGRR